MATPRWIQAFEGDTTGARVTAAGHADIGRAVDIGREGEIALGVRVPNRGVSRIAARVTATESGWHVQVSNRNGAVVHPWGQPSYYSGPEALVHWPLVGIRMLHDGEASQHWALLAASDLTVTPAGPDPSRAGTQTDHAGRPGELPSGEREALTVMFGELLAWPPRHPAGPLQLKQVATRLSLSVSGVQDRLNAAKRRAVRLGSNRDVAPSDPSYLYTLVRAGYLPVPEPAPTPS